MILALSLLIVVLMFCGAPLFSVILAASMLGFYSSEIDLSVIAIEMYQIAETPLLSSLPLFALAGYLMSESQTSQRMLRLIRALFGWMPEGLAIVSVVACALFTASTGASGVTIVALGALLLPALIKEGYKERFSLGLITSSGSMGLLLPPSIPLILYGIIVHQVGTGASFSFDELLVAGLLPGLLMILIMCLWIRWMHRDEPVAKTPFKWQEVRAALRESIWEIPMPLFIVAGIMTGFMAVSEVAAIAALYVLVVEVFIYREIRVKQLPDIIVKAMMMVGGIILVLGVSMAFTSFLVDAQVPNLLFEWVNEHVHSKWTFLLLLNIFLLFLGAILDIFAALIIVVPLILPVAMAFGIHPVHLGIIFLANMQIGYFTPPVGMNLFVASYRFNKPINELYMASLPFMLVLLSSVLLITYWSAMSLVFVEQK